MSLSEPSFVFCWFFLAGSLKNTQCKNILHIFVHQHQIYVLYLSPPSVSQLDKWANQPLHLKSCPRLPGSTLFGPEIRTWEHLTHDDTCGGDYDDYCLKQKNILLAESPWEITHKNARLLRARIFTLTQQFESISWAATIVFSVCLPPCPKVRLFCAFVGLIVWWGAQV